MNGYPWWSSLLVGVCFIVGLFLLAMLILSQSGCAASKSSTYEAALVACNRTAKTLKESVDCENDVRAQFGRSLRDAGAE